MKPRAWKGLLASVVLLARCRSAYYSAWEKFGVYKRDLLKKNVVAARNDEAAAGEQFKDALTHFHDQVLYLKHNLNTEAIASLKGESSDIQAEISRLLDEMNAAIAHADQFINTLPQ